MINKSRKGIIWGMMTKEEHKEIEDAIDNGMTLIKYVDHIKDFSVVDKNAYLTDYSAYWIKEWNEPKEMNKDIFEIAQAYLNDFHTDGKLRKYKDIDGLENILYVVSDQRIRFVIDFNGMQIQLHLDKDGDFYISLYQLQLHEAIEIIEYYQRIILEIEEQVLGREDAI